MANALYAKGREAFLGGDIAADTDNIYGVLIDAALYSPNLSTHNALDDIAAGARVATAGPLSGKTITDGIFDADNLNFLSVAGASVEYLALYKSTGVESTSLLIALFDTGVGLPFTPSGADFLVVWDDGANKIFKL